MKKVFKVDGINCQNCANLITSSLNDDYDDLNIDMSKSPKEVSATLNDEQVAKFKEVLEELGFRVIEEVK